MAKLVVGDTDSVIALAYKDDSNHTKAQKISEQLLSKNYQIIYPNTAIIEAITTLRRALNLADKLPRFVSPRFSPSSLQEQQKTLPENITELSAEDCNRSIHPPDKIGGFSASDYKAHFINKQYQKGTFHVEYITKEIMQKASKIFEQAVSKQNTLFDAIVAATAEKLEADAIFSFDDWYPKLGFKLTD